MRKILLTLSISLFLLGLYLRPDTPNIEETITTEPVPTILEVVTEPTTIPTEKIIPVPASLNVESGNYLETFTDPNTNDYLDYYLFLPNNAVEGMPLIIFLHGDGEVNQVRSLENFAMSKKMKEIYGYDFPFIAISPCTRLYSWTSGTIPTTLKALIDNIVETYHIDTNKIIITGHSRGSMGVWYMISTYGDFFSAAVPVSCQSQWMTLNATECAKVPILAFVGTGMDYSYYGYGMTMDVEAINEAGGNATLVILDGCDHAMTMTEAYSIETFEWMLQQ